MEVYEIETKGELNNEERKDILGTLDAIVLGQTRLVEIERLCFQCRTVLPTRRVGVGTGERGG